MDFALNRVPLRLLITVKQLQEMRPLLNLAELARRANINEHKLFAKVRRGSELTVTESAAIESAFRAVGITVSEV